MGQEIQSRVEQIPFQHREELLQNLLWLSQTGEPAIPAVLQGLEHKEAKVRSSCAWVLGRMRDRRVIPQLKAVAVDPDETVRLEVARSLVMMGDLSQAPRLIEGLDSDRKEVRFLCHEALKAATGRDFGFDHLSPDPAQRQLAAYGWRHWWSEYSGDTWFATNYAQQHGIDPTNSQGVRPGLPAAPMGETMQMVPDTPDGEQPTTEPPATEPPTQPATQPPTQPATQPTGGQQPPTGEAGTATGQGGKQG
jgi:hypothetical protein